eukprot:scaffold112872_cov39-Tisochrysis_lutea.AAC.2
MCCHWPATHCTHSCPHRVHSWAVVIASGRRLGAQDQAGAPRSPGWRMASGALGPDRTCLVDSGAFKVVAVPARQEKLPIQQW